MLKQRILSTLRFFDLQDFPLTLLELEKYLIHDLSVLKTEINTEWEVSEISHNNQTADEPASRRLDNGYLNASRGGSAPYRPQITIDIILNCLETECPEEIENYQ